MKAVNVNQKDQPTDMNDQQYKQPCEKSNRLTVEGKDGVSTMPLNKKGCKIHQQLRKWRTIKECKPRETKR